MHISDSVLVGNVVGQSHQSSTAVYSRHGGAIYANHSSVFVTNSSVCDNNAYNGQGHGGAIFVRGSSLVDTGSNFSANLANNPTGPFGGGAVFAAESSDVTVVGCNFAGPLSKGNNEIEFDDGTNVTFACGTGFTGTPVQLTAGVYDDDYDDYDDYHDQDQLKIPPPGLNCTLV